MLPLTKADLIVNIQYILLEFFLRYSYFYVENVKPYYADIMVLIMTKST